MKDHSAFFLVPKPPREIPGRSGAEKVILDDVFGGVWGGNCIVLGFCEQTRKREGVSLPSPARR